jgi:hypothetical protein
MRAASVIRGCVAMSRQEEEFKSRARYFVDKAARETGPYRDVLLGVAEGFVALATHQAAFDNWPRLEPGPPPGAPREELRQAPRPEPRAPAPQAPRPPTQTPSQIPRQIPGPLPSQASREAPRGTAAPVASPKR